MAADLVKLISQYVEDNISNFHSKRIDSLNKLKLKRVLKKKNPYLFKAKSLLQADQIVKSLTDAFISSNEETIFGDWLESLAIYVNSIVYGGRKSGVKGIDLEFQKDGKLYIVSIKSGPNWGNSSQVSKLKLDFISAKRTFRTSGSNIQVIAINGCCYGQDNKPDKGEYYKLCGQEFWEFISGNNELYKKLIIPIGHNAKERNDEFQESYARMINRFVSEFIKDFCFLNGSIDWDKLIVYNSAKKDILIKKGK